MAHKALGRGLESLIPGAKYGARTVAGITAGESKVNIDKIKPSKNQPRKQFDEEKLRELSESIKLHGLAQPILVSSSKNAGEYEIIAGERRWRACKIAGIKEVPVIIRNVTDQEKFNIALIENIQRENLNPIEEANAYKWLIDHHHYTQEKLSQVVAKDRSVVANALRLLSLPEDVQSLIAGGQISAGHGRMLAGIDNEKKQRELADYITKQKLTVREIERLVSEWKSGTGKSHAKAKRVSPELRNLAEELQRKFGTKVAVSGTSKKGKIEIKYFSLEELERISRQLGVKF